MSPIVEFHFEKHYQPVATISTFSSCWLCAHGSPMVSMFILHHDHTWICICLPVAFVEVEVIKAYFGIGLLLTSSLGLVECCLIVHLPSMHQRHQERKRKCVRSCSSTYLLVGFLGFRNCLAALPSSGSCSWVLDSAIVLLLQRLLSRLSTYLSESW